MHNWGKQGRIWDVFFADGLGGVRYVEQNSSLLAQILRVIHFLFVICYSHKQSMGCKTILSYPGNNSWLVHNKLEVKT